MPLDTGHDDADRVILANTLQSRGWKRSEEHGANAHVFDLRTTGANGNTVIVKVWRAGFVAVSDSTGPVASCSHRVPSQAIVTLAESVRSLTT